MDFGSKFVYISKDVEEEQITAEELQEGIKQKFGASGGSDDGKVTPPKKQTNKKQQQQTNKQK